MSNTKERINELRVKHQPIFNYLDIADALFIPKMAYKPSGKEEIHVSFFPNELGKQQDIYTEFVSREYAPEDPERTLYKWTFNPHYNEYELTDQGVTGRYLIPISELTKVEPEFNMSSTSELDIPDPEADSPINQLTIRDVYAIYHNKPVSHKKFLNEIITTNKR